MLNRKEMFDLALAWDGIAVDGGVDFLSRKIARESANRLYEIMGLSEAGECPTCHHQMTSTEDKQYLSMYGECATCSESRVDMENNK